METGENQLSVVVVDNNSTDSSDKELGHFSIPNMSYKFLRNKKNLGYAGGNNVGISYALQNGADFVLVLNNDTEVDKNLLLELLSGARRNPQAGILSPKIYFSKGFEFHKDRYSKNELGSVLWYAGGTIDWANVYGNNRGVDEVDQGQYDIEEEIDFATGTCMLIRAKALRDADLFDERYYLYLEDTEFSVRIKKYGWTCIYVPKAYLWHKVSQSSAIGNTLNDYFITRNRLLFGLDYAPKRSAFALIRESMRFMINGREWQKRGVVDFYNRRFGRGTWK
jgi:hypothetical protein